MSFSQLSNSISRAKREFQERKQSRTRGSDTPPLVIHSPPGDSFVPQLAVSRSATRLDSIKKLSRMPPVMSPNRMRAYKIDAVKLLDSRVKAFLAKHLAIWKRRVDGRPVLMNFTLSQTRKKKKKPRIGIPRSPQSFKKLPRKTNWVFFDMKKVLLSFGKTLAKAKLRTVFRCLKQVHSNSSPGFSPIQKKVLIDFFHDTPEFERAKINELRNSRFKIDEIMYAPNPKYVNFLKKIDRSSRIIFTRAKSATFKVLKTKTLLWKRTVFNLIGLYQHFCERQAFKRIKFANEKAKISRFIIKLSNQKLSKVALLLWKKRVFSLKKNKKKENLKLKHITLSTVIQELINRKTKLFFVQTKRIEMYKLISNGQRGAKIRKGVRRLLIYNKNVLVKAFGSWNKNTRSKKMCDKRYIQLTKKIWSILTHKKYLWGEAFWWRTIIHTKIKQKSLEMFKNTIYRSIAERFSILK